MDVVNSSRMDLDNSLKCMQIDHETDIEARWKRRSFSAMLRNISIKEPRGMLSHAAPRARLKQHRLHALSREGSRDPLPIESDARKRRS